MSWGKLVEVGTGKRGSPLARHPDTPAGKRAVQPFAGTLPDVNPANRLESQAIRAQGAAEAAAVAAAWAHQWLARTRNAMLVA